MKTYTIKNSDIMHNGKLFPEGSTINLDDKDAQSISDYLIESKPSVLNSFQDKNNSDQKINNKRSK